VERQALAAGCRFLGNGRNLGVAAALNQAARLAVAEGRDWLATFDQDSLLDSDALATLLDTGAAHPLRDRIGVLALSHRDRATGRDYHHGFDILEETPAWRSVRATITSGSMVRVSAFARVGLFDEPLFIDAVDHEFCLRLRHCGMLVIEARGPVMEHSIGAARVRRFLGRRIALTNHSPLRRYYITRNSLEVIRRYILRDFTWSIYNLYFLAVGSVIILMLEDRRWAKLRAMAEGVLHVVLRRFGPR
jgi:rhamnosyltransferase